MEGLSDLVDIDDAALRSLDIVIGVLQQFQNDVLDILADIAGFGQSGCIGHRERHVQDARQRLGQKRFATPCRPDQQDVGFGQLDVVVLGRVIETLVVIVHCHRKHALGVVLSDDITVQNGTDFSRAGDAITRLYQGVLVLFAYDIHAKLDAFIADEHGRPCNELADLMLALAAE
jgi:hypothetical protein